MSKAATVATVAELQNELARLRQQFEAFRRTQRGRELQDELQEARAWSEAVGRTLLLPGLRAFWPFSSADQAGSVYDLSGQGRTLTMNGDPTFGFSGLAPYTALDGAGDYFSRADEAGLDVTGSLTLLAWVWFTNTASTTEHCLAKWGASGQRSYSLLRGSAGRINSYVSGDGSSLTYIAGETVGACTWVHAALRFTPGTELAVFVNHVKAVNTTGIPASIFNSTEALNLGGRAGGAEPMTGRLCLASLCAAALSDEMILGKYHLEKRLFRV